MGSVMTHAQGGERGSVSRPDTPPPYPPSFSDTRNISPSPIPASPALGIPSCWFRNLLSPLCGGCLSQATTVSVTRVPDQPSGGAHWLATSESKV